MWSSSNATDYLHCSRVQLCFVVLHRSAVSCNSVCECVLSSAGNTDLDQPAPTHHQVTFLWTKFESQHTAKFLIFIPVAEQSWIANTGQLLVLQKSPSEGS